MRKRTLFIVFILSLFAVNHSEACTTAVISAKASSDGRPMIWKLRDADETENSLRFFNDGKYAYIGLVNSIDTIGEHVWGGSNSTGFSIMNNASYNVNLNDTSSLKDQEGRFMKLALQTCATLEDFEKLLNSHPRPMGLAANMGVIDGKGGAAYYEITNFIWTKFDANDPKVAPDGYLVRTNYSMSGKKDVGYGFIRYQTAEEIFAKAYKNNQINYSTVIQNFSRCLYHPVFNENFREKYRTVPYGKHFVASDDLITRNSSVSSIIVQGVRAGEPTDLTTVWSLIGYPNTAVAVPVWVRGGENLPKVLRYDLSLKTSPLNKVALVWKAKCYPIGRSDGYHYLNVSELINKEGTGFIQRIEPVEKQIFTDTEKKLSLWRKTPPTREQIESFYSQLNKRIRDFYRITH